jgi:MYXO-CTERM domain-containing protein
VIAELTQAVHLVAPPPDDGGCGCVAGGRRGARASAWFLVAAVLGVALRRRRGSR